MASAPHEESQLAAVAAQTPEIDRGTKASIKGWWLRGGRASPLRERFVEWCLTGAGFLSVATTLGIILVLAGETLSFFKEASLAQLFLDTEWTPLFSEKHFGIWPLVSGTALTAGIAMMVALPLGLLAAIYMSELAPRLARAWLKPALEILAGVPTIVYGYFALVVVSPFLQRFIPGLSGFNALAPGLVMGVMIVPMISSLCEDALYAVPTSLREAAWGLGAGRLSTIFRVVLPAARSGVVASVILAVARAIGETMIVSIAAGQQPRLTFDPRVPVETMTAYIVQISMGDVPNGTLEYRTLFVVGSCLFLLTMAFNLVGQRFARKARLPV